ncbi:putative disease resistance RPP13-like protein 3 [Salvia hispanica]|uniref:putative disease resistance RPP13-like protein 3 n=1 Tax=Salvia hispanica TaxID=49212 RepID=UPI00200928AC|nr:putative disease resistance RPP13-like protein 3 [Salvia hispanica]
MADAAVTFLLENVKQLVVEQASLVKGAEGELKQLENDLALMNAFLMEHSDNQDNGPIFMELVKQIREAVYDAEDALDTLTLKAKSKSKPGGIPSLKTLDLAKKVKELRLQLKPAFDRAMSNLKGPAQSVADGSASTLGTSHHNILKKTTLVLRQDNVVGFADQEAILLEYLSEKTEQLDVISIVGMPGLGKTTLAYKIYRDPKIEFEFPVLIWVYVSQEFNVREVFLTILKKFTREDMSGNNNIELTRLVRSHLEKGRFLLFMDDVWTLEDWREIEAALPKNNKLGKVLITSRYERVAKQTNHNREPHKLRFMLFEESWELLQLEAFGKGNTCPKELEGTGQHIAKQCGGVPLAVVVIGGTLSDKQDRREWEKVSKSVSTYVQEDRRTTQIISLSYNKLPHNLKDCFLYLGMFPEDTEISAWKLIRLWIAEGFIQEKPGRSLEEVAEDNLGDLVARNLVMAETTKANGYVKTCRVHDMIREFCQNEASFANKNLFQEVKNTRHGVLDPAITEIVKRRRLCIHYNVMMEFLHNKPKGPRVRSFVCFSKETISLPTEHTESITNAFDLLRVVDATSLKFTKFPAKLTKLIHLRYIALSGNEFKALPEGVSNLWNLQTVKIDTTSRELEVRVDISKMAQLRHLKTKAAISLKEMRLKGKGGENLQTLSRLSAESCTAELFSRILNLRNLGIRGNLNTLVDAPYLGKLELLEKLKLVHDPFSITGEKKELHRFPHLHNLPPNLRMLTLSYTQLAWTQMNILGGLHSLEVLKLKEMAFKGGRWETQSSGFPNLETLHIARTDLEIWTAASDEPFPKLKNLILKNCEGLQEIPFAIGKGKNLQLLEIERVSPTLVQSAQKIASAKIEKEKQEMQGGEVRARRGGFKLKTSPGDASSSSTSN